MTFTTQLKNIAKEDIRYIKMFGKSQMSNDESNSLKSKLHDAMIMGNSYKGKCKIQFLADELSYVVETTIWAFTDTFVVLKGGLHIPVKSIDNVYLS
jgi:hypothetical protein